MAAPYTQYGVCINAVKKSTTFLYIKQGKAGPLTLGLDYKAVSVAKTDSFLRVRKQSSIPVFNFCQIT